MHVPFLQAAPPPTPVEVLPGYTSAYYEVDVPADIPFGTAITMLVCGAFLAVGVRTKLQSWRRAGLTLMGAIVLDLLFLIIISGVGALAGWRLWDPVLGAVTMFVGAVCSRAIAPSATRFIEIRTGIDLPDPVEDTVTFAPVTEPDVPAVPAPVTHATPGSPVPEAPAEIGPAEDELPPEDRRTLPG
jgi:hypothetical protein